MSKVITAVCTGKLETPPKEHSQYPFVDYGDNDKWVILYELEDIDKIIGAQIQFPTATLFNVTIIGLHRPCNYDLCDCLGCANF